MKGNVILFCVLFHITLSVFPQVDKRSALHKSAFELNESAILIFQKYSYDKDSIKRSIVLLNQAIETDSAYFTAYINKVSLLCALGLNNELLQELAEASKLHKKDPQLICMQAYVLEKTGFKSAAMLKYKEADKLYDELIKADQGYVSNKIAKAFLQMFLKGKREGIRQYREITALYQNKEVFLMKNAFFSFNREQFIKNYCLPPQPLQSGPEIVVSRNGK